MNETEHGPLFKFSCYKYKLSAWKISQNEFYFFKKYTILRIWNDRGEKSPFLTTTFRFLSELRLCSSGHYQWVLSQ